MNTRINPSLLVGLPVAENFHKEMQYVNQCKDGVLFEGSRIAVAEPKVSIVIPVYNKVKYLDLALRSAQNQTMRDLEIICVDDGSNDGSIEKIKSYIEQDERISLIKHEKNEGTLKTRCDGVRAAKGEFIMQLDPDDSFCNPKIAELAYNKSKEAGVDIIHFKCFADSQEAWSIKMFKQMCPNIFDAINGQKVFGLVADRFLFQNIWNKFVRRSVYLCAMELLGDKFLHEHIVCGEDTMNTFPIFKLSKSYIGLDEFGYWYNRNEDSACHDVYSLCDGKLKNQNKANKRILDSILNSKRLLEITDDTNFEKNLAATVFLGYFEWPKPRVVALSDYVDDFKKIADLYINCQYVSDANKDRIKNFLLQLEQELKKNKK